MTFQTQCEEHYVIHHNQIGWLDLLVYFTLFLILGSVTVVLFEVQSKEFMNEKRGFKI